jgi:prepilin-type N-terminal cleavage/methylation domain-containing protein
VTGHRRRAEGGFTLVELLVAITILGIIMGAIGAMIATAFRTSATVSDELSGSRGPKTVSRYWVPDVEQASEVVPGGGGCGTGTPVVAFTSTAFTSNIAAPNQAEDGGQPRTVVWATATRGARRQLVRFDCSANGTATTVVADLDAARVEAPSGSSRKWALAVTVPDRSQGAKTFDFSVDATQAVTPSTTGPAS